MTEANSDHPDADNTHKAHIELLSQAEFDCEQRGNRLTERHAKVHGDRIERLWELLEQLNQVRGILERSEQEWPQWQSGLQSLNRDQFLVSVLGRISAVVFDGRSPTEVAVDAGMPVGLCGNRDTHEPHLHYSQSLDKFWCSADQTTRLPHAAENRHPSRELCCRQ